jgi:regulator of protease activity HflC (stomatin/prohibitin superfamily)
VPSVNRPLTRLAVLASSALLLGGVAAGCSTTQEKAERQQARAKHILEARAERQKRNHHADGPKTHASRGKSAHRQQKGEG